MNSTLSFCLPFLAALGISAMFTISIIDLARKKNLLEANSSIKLHTEQVCSLGGISIFSAFWVAVLLFTMGFAQSPITYLFAGSFLLFLTGVKDDLVGLPPLQRLIIQIGVASLLFYGGIQLTHLPGIEGALPPVLSYFITILLIGGIVNAFNFIDGVNGLSGGLAAISSFAFVVLFYLAGDLGLAMVALALMGSVLGFLYFNFGKAKIFMGDNGSTFIGIMLSYLAISFLRPEIQAEVAGQISPVILVAVMIIPLMDMVKVVLVRVLAKKSPFRGDLTHIHHLLSKQGYSSKQICTLLYMWNITAIVLSFFLLPQNLYIAIVLVGVVGSVPYLVLNFFSRKAKAPEEKKTYAASKIREIL